MASVLAFLEYLYQNLISPKVIRNYLSSITSMASLYNLDPSAAFHPSISRFLKSLSINSPFRPTPREIFDLRTLYNISRACDALREPPLFRALFLVAFYGFLRMSNIAPHSLKAFDTPRHFLRHYLIFAQQGRTSSSSGPRHCKIGKLPMWSNFPPLITIIFVLSEPLESFCIEFNHTVIFRQKFSIVTCGS